MSVLTTDYETVLSHAGNACHVTCQATRVACKDARVTCDVLFDERVLTLYNERKTTLLAVICVSDTIMPSVVLEGWELV